LFSIAKPVQQPKLTPAIHRPSAPVHAKSIAPDQHQGVQHTNENVRLQQEVRFSFL
jgi:hypothetical protein